MMKKVLIAYFSLTSRTEMMAQYIAEGIRISGHEAIVKKIADIKTPDGLAGYDGYIFGSPTHFRGVAEAMKTFLLSAREADLKGKPCGAFGSYTHDGSAPAIILDTLQHVYQMEPFGLGALNLKEIALETPRRDEQQQSQYVAGEFIEKGNEGMRACQDYGRVFGEKLGS
jgi:flavodoxin